MAAWGRHGFKEETLESLMFWCGHFFEYTIESIVLVLYYTVVNPFPKM